MLGFPKAAGNSMRKFFLNKEPDVFKEEGRIHANGSK
jgi:hypothetical protein